MTIMSCLSLIRQGNCNQTLVCLISRSSRRLLSRKTRPVLGSISSSRPTHASRISKSQLSPRATIPNESNALSDSHGNFRQRFPISGRHQTAVRVASRFDYSILSSTREWEGVIFDKDGTLVDIRPAYAQWANVIGHHFEATCGTEACDGLDPLTGHAKGDGLMAMRPWNEVYDTVASEAVWVREASSDVVRCISAQRYAGTVSRNLLARCTGMKFYEASALVCRWRSDVDTAELQEPLFDVPELFSILKQHNMKIAIITADDRLITARVLEKLGVVDQVDALVTGSDAFSPKPQPEPAIHITQKLQLNPENCLCLGDTVSDMLLARNAGFGLGVGVTSGASTREQLSCYTNVIIDRADLLPELLFPTSVRDTLKSEQAPAICA